MWKCSLTTDIFCLSGGSIMCLQSPCKLVILSCSFSKRLANSKYTFSKFIKELKVQVAECWGLIRLGCLSLANLTRSATSKPISFVAAAAAQLHPNETVSQESLTSDQLSSFMLEQDLGLPYPEQHLVMSPSSPAATPLLMLCKVQLPSSLHCGPKILPPSFVSTVSLSSLQPLFKLLKEPCHHGWPPVVLHHCC